LEFMNSLDFVDFVAQALGGEGRSLRGPGNARGKDREGAGSGAFSRSRTSSARCVESWFG